MKTKYKYIQFERVIGTKKWLLLNNKSKAILGLVKWYGPWRQYIVEFEANCIFNNGCLRDIADFLEQLRKKPGETGGNSGFVAQAG